MSQSGCSKIPNTLRTRAFATICSFFIGSATSTANRVNVSMIVTTYKYFSPVGELIPFCSRRDLSKRVGMGDERISDLRVACPDDAGIHAADMLGSHGINV